MGRHFQDERSKVISTDELPDQREKKPDPDVYRPMDTQGRQIRVVCQATVSRKVSISSLCIMTNVKTWRSKSRQGNSRHLIMARKPWNRKQTRLAREGVCSGCHPVWITHLSGNPPRGTLFMAGCDHGAWIIVHNREDSADVRSCQPRQIPGGNSTDLTDSHR